MKRSVAIIGLSLLVAAAVMGGISSRSSTIITDLRPVVATSIFPLYDLTRAVAGETVRVELVLPPGASPHTFDPSPSAIRALARAQAMYTIGYGLDTWATSLATSVGAAVVIVDQNISLIASHEHLGEEERGDHTNEEEHGPTDPHYWLDVRNARIIAATIRDDLSQRFPDHKATFTANFKTLDADLAKLHTEVKTIVARSDSKNVITFHDAWYYFADAYGLNIVGSFEPTSGREPTPRYLALLTDTLNAAKIKTIYAEVQSSASGIDAFAHDHGLQIYSLDDIGGADGRDSYRALMLSNAHLFAKNR